MKNFVDLILLVDRIYAPHPISARAVAIGGGKILALGSHTEIMDLADSKKTRVFDFPQSSLLPGFIDSHCHFGCFLESRRELSLSPEWERSEILKAVEKKAGELERGEWILGRGWNRSNWEDPSFPTGAELDEVTPHHPVALEARDGHAAWLNSLALEKLEINGQTQAPSGGEILTDSEGKPTGVLTENALQLVREGKNAPRKAYTLKEGRAGLEYLYSTGITGFHTLEGKRELRLLQALYRQNQLECRVRFSVPYESLQAVLELGIEQSFGGRLRLSGVKIFADGALGSQTAYMMEAYKGSTNRGMVVTSQIEIEEALSLALPAGLPIVVHAIGDGAVHFVLSALKEAPPSNLLHRIEHCQHIAPENIDLMAELGIIASMQPCHIPGDAGPITRFLPERQKRAFPFRSLLEKEVPLAFGTDFPIEPPPPLSSLVAACQRDQYLEGEESLTRQQALYAYTEGAALSFGEGDIGRIDVGYRGDCVLVPGDFARVKMEELARISPELTVVAGKVVYEKDDSGNQI